MRESRAIEGAWRTGVEYWARGVLLFEVASNGEALNEQDLCLIDGSGPPHEDYHATLLALSMRYLKSGMPAEHVVTNLRGIMHPIPAEQRDGDRPGRSQARFDDIPRVVRQAEEKLGDPEQSHDGPWHYPELLPEGLPAVDPFPLELLPGAIRPWIEDAAERTQAPPDYIVVAAMAAFGSVLKRQITIRPQHNDDWTLAPNLWGAP
jgi:hypothetical protein